MSFSQIKFYPLRHAIHLTPVADSVRNHIEDTE